MLFLHNVLKIMFGAFTITKTDTIRTPTQTYEETMIWENLDKTRRPEIADYSVMRKQPGADGMNALRGMFPDAKADEQNFVLFSTSGVHGTYNTIEEAERFLTGADSEGCSKVTFLIVHPRLVTMRYGVCDPENQDDIDYLKQLRTSSQEAVAGIGAFMP